MQAMFDSPMSCWPSRRNDKMILNNTTFDLYAAKHYSNPHCQSLTEFKEDIKRTIYVRKLCIAYKNGKGLRERLMLNHIVILHNCFGDATADLLFFKCHGFEDVITPFLRKLSILPYVIRYDGKEIDTSKIKTDPHVEERLRQT